MSAGPGPEEGSVVNSKAIIRQDKQGGRARGKLASVTRQLRKNHLRRAMLYQLLRDYVANKSSLTETFGTLARRKREDRDPMYLVFDALLHLVRDKNIDVFDALRRLLPAEDRKSTRLNSSHVASSYA